MWAFGSNLCVEQMQQRCPDAKVYSALILPNAILRFRGVADVAYLKGAECPGGLWEISERDEAALDRYEGVSADPRRPGLYVKKYFEVELRDEGDVKARVLYYQMSEIGIMPPSQHYLDVIAQGYRDFGLPMERLERALAHSWNRKRKTQSLVGRWKRKGASNLAKKVNRDPIPAQVQDNRPMLPFEEMNGMKSCVAMHCREMIDVKTEICTYCGAWQTQGMSRWGRSELRKKGEAR